MYPSLSPIPPGPLSGSLHQQLGYTNLVAGCPLSFLPATLPTNLTEPSQVAEVRNKWGNYPTAQQATNSWYLHAMGRGKFQNANTRNELTASYALRSSLQLLSWGIPLRVSSLCMSESETCRMRAVLPGAHHSEEQTSSCLSNYTGGGVSNQQPVGQYNSLEYRTDLCSLAQASELLPPAHLERETIMRSSSWKKFRSSPQASAGE